MTDEKNLILLSVDFGFISDWFQRMLTRSRSKMTQVIIPQLLRFKRNTGAKQPFLTLFNISWTRQKSKTVLLMTVTQLMLTGGHFTTDVRTAMSTTTS